MTANYIISVRQNPHERYLTEQLRKKKGMFVCTIATTETAAIPNISAAGATPELRRYTAQADVEYLFYERPVTLKEIPKNPLGPPSPVVISKASLNLLNIPTVVIDAGCEAKPRVPAVILREKGLACISTGASFDKGEELWDLAETLAGELIKLDRYVILGESVPGGTTTALSILSFLGVNAFDKISSSMPDNPHDLKKKIVLAAHKNSRLTRNDLRRSPIKIVQAVGDSMQIVNAALAIRLSNSVPVVLAGGTQMLAVACFMKAMEKYCRKKINWKNIGLFTTRWVADDVNADFKGLSKKVDPQMTVLAANMNFLRSRHKALWLYEKGLVKEGVGAGGLTSVGFITRQFSHKRLMFEIDRLYEKLIRG